MSPARWTVEAVRSPRRLRQRFHVRMRDARNGKTVMTSGENYRDRDHAVNWGHELAEALGDANFIDLT